MKDEEELELSRKLAAYVALAMWKEYLKAFNNKETDDDYESWLNAQTEEDNAHDER